MNPLVKRILATATVCVSTASALAQSAGYAARDVNLRAGPSRDYPVVAILQTGVTFTVEGCLSDYRWCDVSSGGARGWVYAGNIRYPYQGSNVPVLGYGAMIGIGIIAFSIGSYWDDHYRARPWYPQRQQWMDRPQPVYRPVPMSPSPPRATFRPPGIAPIPQRPDGQPPVPRTRQEPRPAASDRPQSSPHIAPAAPARRDERPGGNSQPGARRGSRGQGDEGGRRP